jgi:hypothetical protein
LIDESFVFTLPSKKRVGSPPAIRAGVRLTGCLRFAVTATRRAARVDLALSG